ncbi:MAG: ribonuclease H [Bacteroidales bacterium]
MSILNETHGKFMIEISRSAGSTIISFDYQKKELIFTEDNSLSDFLKKHEYQFRKLLHVKRPETYFKGFKLNFSIWDGKDVAAFNDLSKILVLDNRDGKKTILAKENEKAGIVELYIDGSYLQKQQAGGFAVIIKSRKGDYELKTFKTTQTSSSLIELEAAIKGLELLYGETEVRICTDSQYVRKGLTEWIINWKLNDWHTANGEKVKNINHWKKFDKLSQNKYLEFKYIKAHSQHFENTMADLYARDEAGK